MTLNHRLVVTKLTNYRKIYRRTAVAPAHPHGRAAPTPPQSAGPIAAGEAAASGHSGQPRTEEVQARLQHSPAGGAGVPTHAPAPRCIAVRRPVSNPPPCQRPKSLVLKEIDFFTYAELASNLPETLQGTSWPSPAISRLLRAATSSAERQPR